MFKQEVYLKPVHRWSYRRKNNPIPKITGILMVTPDRGTIIYEPRLCYEVIYRDGYIDYTPISDVESGAYIITTEEVYDA